MRRLIALGIAMAIICGFVSVLRAQDSRDDEFLIRGLIRDGLIEVAADRIFDFVFKYPGHARSERMVYDITRSLMQAGRTAKAIPLLRCYLQEFPRGQNRREVNLMLGRALVAQQEPVLAIPLLTTIIEDINQRTDDRLEAKELLASIYLSQGRFEEARILLEETSPKGTSPGIRLILAGAMRGLRQFQQAEEILKSLIARRRRDTIWDAARRDLVQLYLESARYQDIIALLSDWQPPAEGPIPVADRPLALALVLSNYHLGSYEPAWRLAQALDGRGEATADSSRQLPGVLVSLGEWGSAAQVLEGFYQREQDSVRKLSLGWQLLEALKRSNQEGRVAAFAEELAQLSPDEDERYRISRFAIDGLTDIGQRITALERAESALETPALRARLALELGRIAAARGDRDAAFAAFERCRGYGNGFAVAAEADLEQARILAAGGAFPGAVDYAQRVVERLPGSPEAFNARILLLQCHVALKHTKEALETARQIDHQGMAGTVDVAVWRQAARAARAAGSPADEIHFIRRALAGGALDDERLLLDEADALLAAGNAEQADSWYGALAGSANPAIRDAAIVGRIVVAIGAANWAVAQQRCMPLLEGASSAWLGDWALFTAAECAGKDGDPSGEVSRLTELLARAPHGPYADAAVARLQEIAIAAADYGTALQSDPTFMRYSPPNLVGADRQLVTAQRHALAGHFEDAVRLYDVVPGAASLSLEHRYYFALSLHRVGRFADAQRIVETLAPELLILPWRLEQDRILADALFAVGNAPAAFIHYRSLLAEELNPDLRYAILPAAARCAELAGDWPAADRLLREYLETAKTRGESQIEETARVAEIFATHRDYATAIDLYRQIELLITAPEKAVVIGFRIAELTELRSGAEAAAEEYLTIAYRNPGLGIWPARARMKAAALFERSGLRDLAERQYRTVAESWPATEEGQAAIQRLREMLVERELVEEEQLQNPD